MCSAPSGRRPWGRATAPEPRIRARHAGRSAITLIEILVVMAIMTILVSTIVVAGFSAQRRAQVRGTRGLLQKIVQGLEQYRATYRIYVPQDPALTPIDESDPEQVKRYTLPLWEALEHRGKFITVEAEYKESGGTLRDYVTGLDYTWYYYQDAWRQPLKYICRQPFNRFILRSAGPDLELNTGDDILEE